MSFTTYATSPEKATSTTCKSPRIRNGSVRSAAERLSATAASIERIVSGNEHGLSQFAGSGGADLQQLLLEVRDTSAEVRALARQLRENPSALLRERQDNGVELPQ